MSDLLPSPSPEQIAGWIVEARTGSGEALGELLRFSRPFLLTIANDELPIELRAKAGASDLVQDTQLEAAKAFTDFRGHSPAELLGWLRGILRHNLQDFTRRYTDAGKRQVQLEIPLVRLDGERQAGERLTADQSSPSAALHRTEEAARLEMALERLPADYRQVIEWHHREGLSFDQISLRMERSVGAVRKLWSRAIEQIQQQLPHDDESNR